MLYLLIPVAVGYLMGTFSRRQWQTYLMCVPVGVLIILATRFVIPSMQEAPQFPSDVALLLETVVNMLLASLGMFLAHRKAKSGYEF